VSVVELYLDSLGMESSIPWDVVLLSDLEAINFQQNGLTGTILTEITQLMHLWAILWSRNHLTSTLPTAVSRVTEGIR